MKINYIILLVLILFITGCAIVTTGNVVIEDVQEQPVETEIVETTTTVQQETTTTTILETEKTVNIENLKFVPYRLNISKGMTVTWVHNDEYVENMKHMIRIYPSGVASPMLFYGESFSHTFEEAGEYTVIDIVYKKKNVRGKIFVE